MFKICKARLDISHDDVQHVVKKVQESEINQLKPHKIFKFIWFLNHFHEVENPVSALTWGQKILEVHPGHFRLIVAHQLGLADLESIILYNNDNYVRQIAHSIQYNEFEIQFLKQAGTDWWMINVPNHMNYNGKVEYIGREYIKYEEFYKETFLEYYGNFCITHNNENWIHSELDSEKITKINLNSKKDVFEKLKQVYLRK